MIDEKDFIRSDKLKGISKNKLAIGQDASKIANKMFDAFCEWMPPICTDERVKLYEPEGGTPTVIYNSVSIAIYKILQVIWEGDSISKERIEANLDKVLFGVKIMLNANWDKIQLARKQNGIVNNKSTSGETRQ